MFSTRLENTIGELGELVSHALLPDIRMQVGVAGNTELFEVMLGTQCIAIWMTYGDGQEPELLVMISFDFTSLPRLVCWQ